MRVQADPGTEQWIPWAKKQAQALAAQARDLKLEDMRKSFMPDAGTVVFVRGRASGDHFIRIVGSGPWIDSTLPGAFPFLEYSPKWDEDSLAYVPSFFQRTKPQRPILFSPVPVTARGRSDESVELYTGGADVFVYPYDLRNGRQLIADAFGVSVGSPVLELDGHAIDRSFEFFLPSVGSGGAPPDGARVFIHTPDGHTAPSEFPWDAFLQRAKAILTSGSTWQAKLRPLRGGGWWAIVRRGDERSTSVRGTSVYAERYDAGMNTVETFSDNSTQPAPYYGDGTRFGEFGIRSNSNAYDFTYTNNLSEKGAGGFALTPAPFPVSGPAQIVTGSSNGSARTPYPFNAGFGGYQWPVITDGMSLPFKRIDFAGVTVHDDLVTPTPWPSTIIDDQPYLCQVFPAAILIGGDQYFWVNTCSVKPTIVAETRFHSPGQYQTTSPYVFTWKTIVIKNGAQVSSDVITRVYTSWTDEYLASPPPEGWDSLDPVDIYVPTDGARIGGDVGGEDWMCGVVYRQSIALTGGTTPMPITMYPAIWKADRSASRIFTDFPRAFTGLSMLSSVTQQRNLTGSGSYGAFFSKFKGKYYVCFGGTGIAGVKIVGMQDDVGPLSQNVGTLNSESFTTNPAMQYTPGINAQLSVW